MKRLLLCALVFSSSQAFAYNDQKFEFVKVSMEDEKGSQVELHVQMTEGSGSFNGHIKGTVTFMQDGQPMKGCTLPFDSEESIPYRGLTKVSVKTPGECLQFDAFSATVSEIKTGNLTLPVKVKNSNILKVSMDRPNPPEVFVEYVGAIPSNKENYGFKLVSGDKEYCQTRGPSAFFVRRGNLTATTCKFETSNKPLAKGWTFVRLQTQCKPSKSNSLTIKEHWNPTPDSGGNHIKMAATVTADPKIGFGVAVNATAECSLQLVLQGPKKAKSIDKAFE